MYKKFVLDACIHKQIYLYIHLAIDTSEEIDKIFELEYILYSLVFYKREKPKFETKK